jgi:hypothetical protein
MSWPNSQQAWQCNSKQWFFILQTLNFNFNFNSNLNILLEESIFINSLWYQDIRNQLNFILVCSWVLAKVPNIALLNWPTELHTQPFRNFSTLKKFHLVILHDSVENCCTWDWYPLPQSLNTSFIKLQNETK